MKAEYKGLYEKFGLNIVYYRKRKKLTQFQLAELVDVDKAISVQSSLEMSVFRLMCFSSYVRCWTLNQKNCLISEINVS